MIDKTNRYHEHQYEVLSRSGKKIIIREEEYVMDADDIARWDLLTEEFL